jgi:hypothetical protein
MHLELVLLSIHCLYITVIIIIIIIIILKNNLKYVLHIFNYPNDNTLRNPKLFIFNYDSHMMHDLKISRGLRRIFEGTMLHHIERAGLK